ncbi:type VI secretion system-associated protein TagO [Pseudochrobactrum sp. MP213Fo]|uniref:type VI secretion system-associated protein TagO n=1 Tax=Pseudochrobactrum sp. MP213Fo TaxID=3022250 RepID=UPI003BA215CA
MRGFLTAGAVLLMLTSMSSAENSKCIKTENDLDRLACYDNEAGRTPKSVLITETAGKWSPTSTTSKLTDDKNITLQLASEEIVNCGWNKGDKITLILRCQEQKTALFINTQCHMTSSEYNGYGDVTYRLDSDKAQIIGMSESTNNRSLGLWTGGKSIPMIKQMLGKQQMVVRMTPFNESAFTATFDLTGLEAAIKPLRDECKW